jgi:hypothetical protein
MVILAQDYTFRFRDDGITLNPDSLELPFIDVHKVAGLDMPDFRTNERAREGMDGGSLDIDFAEMRTIVIDAEIIADATSVLPWLEALKANYSPSNINYPFYFYGPGLGERVIMSKSLGIKGDWDSLLRNGRCAIQIQLKAEDPTIYFGEYTTLTTGLTSGGSGSGFPRPMPFGFGTSISGSNTVNAVNLGNKPVGALVRFYNVINPGVVSDTLGKMLQLNTTVAAGEFYELDLRNNTVRLNGIANRRNVLVNASRWFMLEPGDNMLRFIGTPNGTARMDVIYRSGSY